MTTVADKPVTQEDLEKAFASGFAAEFPSEQEPAQIAETAAPAAAPAAEPAPAAAGSDATPADGGNEEAPNPKSTVAPELQAALDQLAQLRTIASQVPQLTDRLRKAEGHIGNLTARANKPAPAAPPKMEKVDALRNELPEVLEGIEELLDHRLAQFKQKDPDTPPVEPGTTAAPDTSVLAAEAPDWEQVVVMPEFDRWMKAQPAEYQSKIETTTNQAVMLAAVTRFKDHQTHGTELKRLADERAADVARIQAGRQTRTAAAAVPTGAGARRPAPAMTPEEAFAAGYRSVAGGARLG